MLSKSLAEGGGGGGGGGVERGGSWQEWFVGRLFRFLLRLSSPTRLLGRLEVACPLMVETPLPRSVLTVEVRWLRLGEELPVDQAEDEKSDHGTGDDRLQVLHPELVLQLARALLKLACTVLKCVCLLVKLIQFLVSLENLFHIVPHDPHHLIHLGLLLCHPLLGHYLLHLGRARQRSTVGSKRSAIWADNRFSYFACLSVPHRGSGESFGGQVLDPATHDRHVRGKKHAVARRASTVRTGFGLKNLHRHLAQCQNLNQGLHKSKLAKVIVAQLIDHHCHIELSIRSPKFVS